MKKVILLIAIVIIFVIFFIAKSALSPHNETKQNTAEVNIVKNRDMKITSTTFGNQEKIPVIYTCKGENYNPALEFSDVPKDAKSLVLIMDDPDAPGGIWVHWTIFDMNPTEKGIAEKSKPSSGIEGTTSFGKSGYGGPCPPSGTHHYFFKLYALDTKLQLSQSAQKKEIEEKMKGHILDQAELVGLFSSE